MEWKNFVFVNSHVKMILINVVYEDKKKEQRLCVYVEVACETKYITVCTVNNYIK